MEKTRLKNIRLGYEWSLQGLGDRLGVSNATVFRAEKTGDMRPWMEAKMVEYEKILELLNEADLVKYKDRTKSCPKCSGLIPKSMTKCPWCVDGVVKE